ncbi:MAG: hypothetical protein FK733_16430 [Asgard group archaeon]|nr:hypothetical protein [Asgard group archaeon]
MTDEVLSASNKQVSEWAMEMIKVYKLSKNTNFDDLANFIIKFFKEKLPGYEIYVYETDTPTLSFEVRKIKPKKESKSDDLDILGGLFAPLSDEERNISSKLLVTFDETSKQLDILHPIHYSDTIKKIGLQTFDNPPKYSDDNFIRWAAKCIEFFRLTKTTPLLDLIKNSIQFFDMLFTTFSVKFTKYKRQEKFPVYVEKLADRPLSWALESDMVRKSYFATYLHILEKLKRKDAYPKDSEYFYSLAYIYEVLGIKPRAKYFGKIGLELKHHDSFELSQLVLYYAEHQRFQDGTIYMKKLGGIYQQKGQKKLALQMWQGASRFDQGSDVAAA